MVLANSQVGNSPGRYYYGSEDLITLLSSRLLSWEFFNSTEYSAHNDVSGII